MGEKFAANPVTGTGSMSVPIATSPGRSGFGPQLSLSYDSGAGNGPFGFGWSLSLPSITRKTDKGLPRYDDATESDVFILSGAEDLVPVLVRDNQGKWVPESLPDRTVNGMTYAVKRYRPRMEGLFARIERWTNVADASDVHWRSISQDNILTLYGKDENSRIADPEDRRRIFSWLICETRDDKGNGVLYHYKKEDGVGVNLSLAHERNRGDRTDPRRSANRYLKHIYYGNRTPLLDDTGQRPHFLNGDEIDTGDWMFEVVFDYGEHAADAPTPGDSGDWDYREDPFSTYRSGFEVRTTRLCQRVLMFHHIPDLPDGTPDGTVGYEGLVRSTDFTYAYEQNPDDGRIPIYSLLLAVSQSGYKRQGDGYGKRSLPPVEFEYSQPVVQDVVEEVDPVSVENSPVGLDGAIYQWTDLHGEGIPGILTEQAGGWFYKRNLSPINERRENGTVRTEAKFAPLELVALKPNLALAGGAQFMDLAGDGQPDLVVMDGPMPGLYEHDGQEGWQPFRPFISRLNRDMSDPNLKLVDLDGDGHADVLITEQDTLVWHPALAEAGFGAAQRVAQALDEEQGPRLVFADGIQSIYLADLSGDGLTDLVRIRNGEVCYWPNLGYGRFGAKVTMDNAPYFDNPDQFDQQRLRLADIDGTGTTDIIYLHRDGVRLYFNQSGNSWSAAEPLQVFPDIDNVVSIVPTDLLGNGTACLVWSSPLLGDAGRQMRYVSLMGEQKPHLLIKTRNNLGAETVVHYAPSTKFYLQDKRDGNPWITRLPFPVHVVERVETYDHISRNRFVTRYAYHHGYFDGEEREFRGFGMVEQWDTEEFSALVGNGVSPAATNIDAASHVPPVHTKTWFHTGFYLDRAHISRQFEAEYYREPGLSDEDFQALLLPDTTLPAGLTLEEEREACRALKGMMLRQEVYADDAPPGSSDAMIQRAQTPYTVVEQDFTIRPLQPRADHHHGVFFAHPRETITYHYERNPSDPRIQHAMTLEVDDYGNVLKDVAIGYGRRQPDPDLPLDSDRLQQTQRWVTYAEHRFTNAIESAAHYRTPLPCETRTYELTGFSPTEAADRFQFSDFVQPGSDNPEVLIPIFDSELNYEESPTSGRQRRSIAQVRSLYRPNDFGAAQNNPLSLLPLGQLESLALPGESYQLAFTPGLIAQVFQRSQPGQPSENLLPNPAEVLGGPGADQGGYVDLDGDDRWWMPSGRLFYSPHSDHPPAQELAYAQQHFFLPHRNRDPFGAESFITYDDYDLLVWETRDPLDNRVTVGERDADENLTTTGNDYRVLQPWLLMDANRNRAAVAFDALGLVVGTAVMGKPEETLGDSLTDFEPDLDESVMLDHLEHPLGDPHAILQRATTRLVYDLFAYRRTKDDDAHPEPVVVYTLARETHAADLNPGEQSKIQHSFAYSDGFEREIQVKVQAEPGPLDLDDADAPIADPRWVGSGWTIFNNKEKPVRQYEPFFSDTHRFEFARVVGVSPILFYDPMERVVATLHPNHTYEKVVFDPWHQVTWDVSDTVTSDPRTDGDIGGYVRAYFVTQPDSWQTWYAQRQDGALGQLEQVAATKASAHADTPTTAYLDSLGRPFLTLAHNGWDAEGMPELYPTRVELDVEGNPRTVRDAFVQTNDGQGRIVMHYAYNLLGPGDSEEEAGANRIYQSSMEAGERWMLTDVAGNPIRAWDSRGHTFRTEYDRLRRPLRSFVTGADPANPTQEWLTERLVYGEQHPENVQRNLRGQLYLHLDPAGAVSVESVDFKGNPLEILRRLAQNYKQGVEWRAIDAGLPTDAAERFDLDRLDAALAPSLEADRFISRTTYDALNRPVRLQTPDNSIILPTYNEANLLERMAVQLRGAEEVTAFVSNIDYDAKGQRVLIEYGNQTRTEYHYDPLTFRLTRLKTLRWSDLSQLQDLSYTSDPVGNITHIDDRAQQTLYFNNEVVTPSNDYTYDAIYRLITATGREHIGQVGQPHTTWDDQFRVNLPHPNDGQAMRTYTEHYDYDSVGNFLDLIHDAMNGNWHRSYSYNEPSLIEPNHQRSNRLSRTEIGNGISIPEPYTYDAHGNMTTMPHLPLMRWDYRDQLQATARQVVNEGTPETTYYVYDAAGERVRKVTERQNGTRKNERIYLGGFEIFRAYDGSGNSVTLERETLHVMDDQQRIALVETRTFGSDNSPGQLIRFQVGNHLGSAALEVDGIGEIISYEEFYPYGCTSYEAVGSQTETPKRYRFTGKERDEESGLNYHGARYYALWLGRWTSCDPISISDGPNRYTYTRGNPVKFTDLDGQQAGNAGEFLGFERVGDLLFARYRAKEGTWISASLAEFGYNEWFGPDVAYGAYLDIVFDPHLGELLPDPDFIHPGQEYIFPVERVVYEDKLEFKDEYIVPEPQTGSHVPSRQQWLNSRSDEYADQFQEALRELNMPRVEDLRTRAREAEKIERRRLTSQADQIERQIEMRVSNFEDFSRRLERNWNDFWRAAYSTSPELARDMLDILENKGELQLYLHLHRELNTIFRLNPNLRGDEIRTTYLAAPRYLQTLYPRSRDQSKFQTFAGYQLHHLLMPHKVNNDSQEDEKLLMPIPL
ncbi:SpvB/TcaC N-terminal domain-containing protein [Nodosilinea sp. P-1105]|uniref:SpvB/TcaC N-terminal domain-containing protein n=1 Tax=Nodosilinea sp. P-1105 TaxID=2546229 RepID=UPI0019814773|nr:SpvB/TcaC N-terminal domain-containing protein [Nodosilinea sp. P-1105]